MSIRKPIILLFFPLILSLASCTLSNFNSSATKVSTIEPLSTTFLPEKAIPTNQAMEKTDEAIGNTGTALPGKVFTTGQPKDSIDLSCLDSSSNVFTQKDLPYNLLVGKIGEIFVFDPMNNKKTSVLKNLPGLTSYDYFVSPDGKNIAYRDYDKNKDMWLFIEPVEELLGNNTKINLEVEKGIDRRLDGWLTDRSLVMTRKNSPTSFYSTLIVNPFTGEKKEFILEDLPDYKQFKSSGIGLYHFPRSNLMPDPSNKLVVYPESLGAHSYISLRNLETGKTLARIEDLYDYSGDPLWAQDGSNFLITAGTLHTDFRVIYDWFEVSRDGTVRQLTNYANEIQNNLIWSASRSNDGQYLAYTLVLNDGSKKIFRYYIVNLKSEKLEGFCIEPVVQPSYNAMDPVWSPDSQYLAISNIGDQDNGPLILVDVHKKQAYQILKDLQAIGWIVKP